MAKLLFIDLETTGFSREWDYIIEVAAVLYDEESDREIDSFHEYIKPGKSIPPKITDLTGIDNFKVRNCRSEKAVLMDLIVWVKNLDFSKIVGHNYKAFDKSFLNERCDRNDLLFNWNNYEEIDTLSLARQLSKNGTISVVDHKQQTLANYYGIQYEAHSAIEDVRALIKIYQKMGAIKKKSIRETLGF